MRAIAKGHWKTTDLVQQVLWWDECSRKGHQRELEVKPWPESNICTHTCTHTYMSSHTHTHTQPIYTLTCARSHTCTHMCTHGHEHTHTHTLLPPGTQFQDQLLTLCGHCHLSDWGPDPNWEPPWAQIINTLSLIIVFIFLLYKLYIIIYLIIYKIKNIS